MVDWTVGITLIFYVKRAYISLEEEVDRHILSKKIQGVKFGLVFSIVELQ